MSYTLSIFQWEMGMWKETSHIFLAFGLIIQVCIRGFPQNFVSPHVCFKEFSHRLNAK